MLKYSYDLLVDENKRKIVSSPEKYVLFLKFMGKNSHLSLDNQLALFTKDPKGQFYTADEWAKLGVDIRQEKTREESSIFNEAGQEIKVYSSPELSKPDLFLQDGEFIKVDRGKFLELLTSRVEERLRAIIGGAAQLGNYDSYVLFSSIEITDANNNLKELLGIDGPESFEFRIFLGTSQSLILRSAFDDSLGTSPTDSILLTGLEKYINPVSLELIGQELNASVRNIIKSAELELKQRTLEKDSTISYNDVMTTNEREVEADEVAGSTVVSRVSDLSEFGRSAERDRSSNRAGDVGDQQANVGGEKGSPEYILSGNEINLSSERRAEASATLNRPLSGESGETLTRRGADVSSSLDTEAGGRAYRPRETKADGVLGLDSGNADNGSVEISDGDETLKPDFEGHSDQGSSGKLSVPTYTEETLDYIKNIIYNSQKQALVLNIKGEELADKDLASFIQSGFLRDPTQTMNKRGLSSKKGFVELEFSLNKSGDYVASINPASEDVSESELSEFLGLLDSINEHHIELDFRNLVQESLVNDSKVLTIAKEFQNGTYNFFNSFFENKYAEAYAIALRDTAKRVNPLPAELSEISYRNGLKEEIMANVLEIASQEIAFEETITQETQSNIIERHAEEGLASKKKDVDTSSPPKPKSKSKTILEKNIDKKAAPEAAFFVTPKTDFAEPEQLSLFELLKGTNSDESLEELGETKSKSSEGSLKNFKLDDDFMPERLTPGERLELNINAIKTLKGLESGELNLTSEAQETLAKYVGWGGLSDVFDESKSGQWASAREFLKENLSPAEFKSARESTLTSFYTPKFIINEIYGILGKMGLREGNVLEPSLGVGSFIGSVPDVQSDLKFYGTELDSISGKIAKYLYPESEINISGFEEIKYADNFFDLAIGNVPFGNYSVFDRDYDQLGLNIHDYFFAKALDKVRVGGVVAFITSSGTLDKKDDDFRRYLSNRADFLGAIRLPNDAFKGVAGTEVTSDIVFLKKRSGVVVKDQDFIHAENYGDGKFLNHYFKNNPSMVLGHLVEVPGPFGSKLECVPAQNMDLRASLREAGDVISNNSSYEPRESNLSDSKGENQKTIPAPADDSIKNYSYTVDNNKLYFREDDLLIEQNLDFETEALIKNYCQLSVALRDVIVKQMGEFSDHDIEGAQKVLNAIYDNFVKQYGYINSAKNMKVLEDDSNLPLVSSLENMDEKGNFLSKADIFYKRTIVKTKSIERAETALDSLNVSLLEKGRVDLPYMELLTGKGEKELLEELKGEIFLNIDKAFDRDSGISPYVFSDNAQGFSYVTKSEYLSGNIAKKIDIVKSYEDMFTKTLEILGDSRPATELRPVADNLDKLQFQLEHLEASMPEPLKASEISVRLGANWIDPKIIQIFMVDKIVGDWNLSNVFYSKTTNNWNVTNKSMDSFGGKYRTERVTALKLLEDVLNLRETKVYDTVTDVEGKERRVLNEKETILAAEKQALMKEDFRNWVFKNEHRRDSLVSAYNKRFNVIKNREYDGSGLYLPGSNPNIELKDYQKNVVMRCLQGGNTLIAHSVGAGKTFNMVAAAMESKRLGLSTKSMFVVPNHLTGQVGRDFMTLYPGANILVATKKDFEQKNRKKFLGKIVTGSYDAVVIGHSQFERIPMSKKYQALHMEREIESISATIRDIRSEYRLNQADRYSIKELEKQKKRVEVNLKKIYDGGIKDDVVTFEELGIDKLFIDEAHNYKNLYIQTKMQNVAGISQTNAKKSADLFMKCRYLDEVTGGKGVVFATGTPVSNSMVELYTMQRYLQYDLLTEMGLEHFDSWAANFGDVVSDFEFTPEGSGFRQKTRFSKFCNLPELMSMFKEVADVKTADSLDLIVPEAEYEIVETMPTDDQKQILKSFAERAELVRSGSVDPRKDNMLKITSDGKKLALDQRIFNENLPDNPNSKVNTCVSNVFSIWEGTKSQKSTQLIFSDMSVPGEGFNIYDDVKKKLVRMGIPAEEVAFIHDAKTEAQREALFEKVRTGEVRVLLGSTPKMGTGTNVQTKLCALHDLDVPWRPSDLEQRAGRIVRQGNENDKVKIFRYVTKDTFDAYLWQTIENKQKFISQIMTSKSPTRVLEDIDGQSLNYAEIKALALGDGRVKEKLTLENEINRLKLIESDYKAGQARLEKKVIKDIPSDIEAYSGRVLAVENDLERLKSSPVDGKRKFEYLEILGEKIYEKKAAGEKLLSALKEVGTRLNVNLGSYRGFDLSVSYDTHFNVYRFCLKGEASHYGELGNDPIGNIARLDNVLDKMPEKLVWLQIRLDESKKNLELAKKELGKPFEKAAELEDKLVRLAKLNSELSLAKDEETLEEPQQADPIEKLDKNIEKVKPKSEEKDILKEISSKKSVIEKIGLYKDFIDKDKKTLTVNQLMM